MARVTDARLDIYYVDNDTTTPDLQVPATDIKSVDTSQGYNGSRDAGTVIINNGTVASGGTYNGQITDSIADEIDIGQRIEFRALTEYNDPADTLDDNLEARRWTAYISEAERSITEGMNLELTLTLEDFVFGVLARRTVARSFINTDVAGDANDIVNKIVSENAPEVGDMIFNNDEELSIGWNYDNLLEAVRTTAIRTGSAFDSLGTDLIYVQTINLSSDFTLTEQDYSLPISREKSDEDLANLVYVTGGDGVRVDQSQTTGSTLDVVTDSVRFVEAPVSAEKSSIPRVDVKTAPYIPGGTPSTDNLVCRLQKTDGSGNAIAPGDRTADLGRASVPAEDIQTGFTTFDVRAEDIGTDTVAIIMESDGSTGQQIAGEDTNSDGNIDNLAYETYNSYPVVAIAEDNSSQAAYRTNEVRVRSSVPTNDEAQEIAQSKINRNSTPPEYLNFEANSAKTHQASTSDVFDFTESLIGASGKFIIVKIDRSYNGNRLVTNINAQNLNSL